MDSVIDEEEILKDIIRTVQPIGIARKLLKVIRVKGSTVKISKREDTIAAFVPEMGEVPIRVADASNKILAVPYKLGQGTHLSEEEIEDAGIDIVKESILELNYAIQKKEDQDFINCLLIGAANTIFFTPYTSTPETSPDDFPSGVDPFDRTYMESVIRERPLLDDVVSAMKIIEENGGSPDYLIINPREAQDLRRRDELKKQLETFGMKVIITNLIDEYFSVVFDSRNAALLLERRPPTIYSGRDYEKDGFGIIITERICPVCVNGNVVVRIQRVV